MPVTDVSSDKVSILVVDDNPEKVVALGAILDGLGQEVVRAYSGKEALRCLLTQDFAVILLDVNMPGMDGFETAALIRQRQRLEHIPIIFITSYGDEVYVNRGYSLGAVDYIATPVVPEVLKTKVSVFVDLAKMTAHIRRQARSLEQRAVQLNRLTTASLEIHAAVSIEKLLRIAADTARELAGAHQAYISVITDSGRAQTSCDVSFSERYRPWRNLSVQPPRTGLEVLARTLGRSVRLSDGELKSHPAYVEAMESAGLPPLRGWLAAALTGRDGRFMGLIELSDKQEGEFSSNDEVVIVQLAQMASIAIENALFAEAREANRLKDEFLATLSHELRTPLNAILGWARLLRTEQFGADRFTHGLDVIERNVKAQTKLIEDLLDVSRITAGKARLNLRPIALGAVVTAAVDAARPAAEAKRIALELKASIASEDDRINGDPDRLQQVVGNLLGNSLKFTPQGGSVEIRLERDNGELSVSIVDNGIGIKPEYLPYIFDRFRQVDSSSTRAHGGLGLGLTLVRHFVELHGGSVTVASDGEGRGSLFTVRLPRAANGAACTTLAVATQPDAMSSIISMGNLDGLRILVVDDELDARELVAQVLARGRAEVATAGSVDEARIEFDRRVPDVLVSHHAMPVKDGYTLIRTIRRLPAPSRRRRSRLGFDRLRPRRRSAAIPGGRVPGPHRQTRGPRCSGALRRAALGPRRRHAAHDRCTAAVDPSRMSQG